MANFTNVLYVADNAATYKIRMSTADVTAQPTAPGTGAPTIPGKLKTSKGLKQFGLRPRRVQLSRQGGTAPNIKTYYDRLIVCKVADATALLTTGTVTINSVVWTVNSITGETSR